MWQRLNSFITSPPLETFSFTNAVIVFDPCLQVYDVSIYLGLKLWFQKLSPCFPTVQREEIRILDMVFSLLRTFRTFQWIKLQDKTEQISSYRTKQSKLTVKGQSKPTERRSAKQSELEKIFIEGNYCFFRKGTKLTLI